MSEFWMSMRECATRVFSHSWPMWSGTGLAVVAGVGELFGKSTWGAAMNLPPYSLPVLLFVIGVFGSLIMAFHDVRKERDAVKTQRDDLQNLRSYEAELDKLSTFLDEGNNKLLNANVTNEAELQAWQANWNEWHQRASGYLEKNFGLRERNLFKNIVLVLPRKIDGSYAVKADDNRHNHSRCILVQELESLRGTIVRHSERAQKWRVASQSEINLIAP